MILVNAIPQGSGWEPINHMIRLAARLFEAEVIDAAAWPPPSAARRTLAALRRRGPSKRSSETCLLIGTSPGDLQQLFNLRGWRSRFRWIGAWVIDSFWTEWIPGAIRLAQPFDALFITSREDIDAWERVMRPRPLWLPWGTDTLGLGSGGESRPWDLIRVGRQPPEWDDDLATAEAASRLKLTFHPRPPYSDRPAPDDYAKLLEFYRQSKYLLAFSNLVSPTRYTHPTRDYLTGRWVDALACGAVVAGVAPRGPGVDALLWPGATLELGGIGRADGLRVIADALARWTPRTAARNHAMSLRRLDWRWRFEQIAAAAGESPEPLANELRALRERIESLPADGALGSEPVGAAPAVAPMSRPGPT